MFGTTFQPSNKRTEALLKAKKGQYCTGSDFVLSLHFVDENQGWTLPFLKRSQFVFSQNLFALNCMSSLKQKEIWLSVRPESGEKNQTSRLILTWWQAAGSSSCSPFPAFPSPAPPSSRGPSCSSCWLPGWLFWRSAWAVAAKGKQRTFCCSEVEFGQSGAVTLLGTSPCSNRNSPEWETGEAALQTSLSLFLIRARFQQLLHGIRKGLVMSRVPDRWACTAPCRCQWSGFGPAWPSRPGTCCTKTGCDLLCGDAAENYTQTENRTLLTIKAHDWNVLTKTTTQS